MSKESTKEIILDESQKEAIRSSFNHPITVITGAAGSGKSTICKKIVDIAQGNGLSIRLMSPTGRAAQVLSQKTSYPAQTIHRSLKIVPGEDFAKEQIKEDITIIDEVSMIGIDTMFAVMEAIEENPWGHIVFVGDPNQLPSVSPGNFLTDLIQSGCVNVVKLDRIHRQDEDSHIPVLADQIAKGRVVEIPETAKDMKWHHLTSAEPFEALVERVIKDFMRENNMDDLQIIAPMYKGNYGINKVNEIVQSVMAERNGVKDAPFTKGFMTLFVGDRVLQTENNYDKEIFNGDMGTVVEAGRKIIDPSISDEQKDCVVVNFYGEKLTYVGDEIEELKLAWCCSVHKFQGSQSPYVICMLPSEAQIMMTKELLYTALTRAEKKVEIYGSINMFNLAPTKSAVKKRYTNMNNIIRELKENKKILTVLE